MSEDTISTEPLFRVVFLHEFDRKANLDGVRNKVISRFKLSNRCAMRVFAGRPIVVRKRVDAETAFRLKIALAEIGALAHVETIPEVDDTDALGYVERRAGGQRTLEERRAQIRDGQMMLERRHCERRTAATI